MMGEPGPQKNQGGAPMLEMDAPGGSLKGRRALQEQAHGRAEIGVREAAASLGEVTTVMREEGGQQVIQSRARRQELIKALDAIIGECEVHKARLQSMEDGESVKKSTWQGLGGKGDAGIDNLLGWCVTHLSPGQGGGPVSSPSTAQVFSEQGFRPFSANGQ